MGLKHRIFIYGTLKKGFPNHDRYMGSAEKIGNYHTVDHYPLVLIGERHVPCMINVPGEGQQVKGELYEVDNDCLKKLDALERIKEPDGYRRLKIRVRSVENHHADTLVAHAYLISSKFARDLRSDHLKEYRLEDAEKYKPGKKK